jgi:sulfonate transport system permease protein
MDKSERKWLDLFPVLLALSLWEVCYYLGFTDRTRLSHPLAVIPVLLDRSFLEGFGLLVAQLGCASLLGGACGIAIGSLVIRSTRLAHAAIRFLHIGLWFPLLVFWAIPIPYSGYPTRFNITIWTWTVSVFAVTLYTCYHYLNSRVILQLEWVEARQELIRGSVLQALFISIISLVWLGPYGWNFFWLGVPFIDSIYAAAILLVVVIVLVNGICRYSFEQTSLARGEIIRRMLIRESHRSILDAWLIFAAFVLSWEVLSLSDLGPFISSPSAILKEGYHLIFTYEYRQSVFINDIPISLVEVVGGLILGGITAFAVSKAESLAPIIKPYVLPLLPITYVVPILFPLCLMGWVGPVNVWSTLLGVASVCFFPCIEIFSGLKGSSILCRILVAADHALPIAFVAMVFGEAMNSSAGLGFLIWGGRATFFFPEGLGAVLITVLLFVILSFTFRLAAKNELFRSDKGGQGASASGQHELARV